MFLLNRGYQRNRFKCQKSVCLSDTLIWRLRHTPLTESVFVLKYNLIQTLISNRSNSTRPCSITFPLFLLSDTVLCFYVLVYHLNTLLVPYPSILPRPFKPPSVLVFPNWRDDYWNVIDKTRSDANPEPFSVMKKPRTQKLFGRVVFKMFLIQIISCVPRDTVSSRP